MRSIKFDQLAVHPTRPVRPGQVVPPVGVPAVGAAPVAPPRRIDCALPPTSDSK